MKWKDSVKEYLRFSRKDRIGSVVILICILIIYLLPNFLPENKLVPVPLDDSTVFKKEKNENYSNWRDQNTGYSDKYVSNRNYELFYFDPNSISADQWQQLGLRDKTIRTILNYRKKGGRFRNPDDLRKIYGLRQEEFERIRNYVRISAPLVSGGDKRNYTTSFATNKPIPGPNAFHSVDINAADTSAWIALPGIGSKLAARIVNFRDKLGGFYSVDQVAETYGLPDSTFRKIRPMLKMITNSVQAININTAGIEDLKKHPYIRWQLANAIIAYRNEHGPFLQLEDLKNILVITDEIYNRIIPYLKVN